MFIYGLVRSGRALCSLNVVDPFLRLVDSPVRAATAPPGPNYLAGVDRPLQESFAQREAGSAPVHALLVHLAHVPAQLAVVLSPITLRGQFDLDRFLPTVGSDEHAVGSASRTPAQATV